MGEASIGVGFGMNPSSDRSDATIGGSGARSRSGLVAACLRNDQSAWEALVRGHAGLVYTVVRRCGFDGEEAADLFQQIWVTVWDGLPSLRDEAGLSAWIATIAARQAKRTLSRRVRLPLTPLDDVALEQPDPELPLDQIAIGNERSAALRRALARLSERDRQIVEYFFYNPTEPSYAELAERLGISQTTIGPTRHRALRRLREALSGAPELAEPDEASGSGRS